MLRNHGVEHALQSKSIMNKFKMTCKINNGVEFPFQERTIKEKAKYTCEQLWGVSNYAQSKEYHKNRKHRFCSDKYPGFTFDSTWEVKVYEFCMDNNIQIEYSPSISYEYEYDGRTWTYHPDFLINGKVYEVKGDHFFKYNESSCQEEMFCPYRNPRWSDDEYDWLCKKFEAKHQCMIKNNVLILRDKDIHNLNVDMFVN